MFSSIWTMNRGRDAFLSDRVLGSALPEPFMSFRRNRLCCGNQAQIPTICLLNHTVYHVYALAFFFVGGLFRLFQASF